MSNIGYHINRPVIANINKLWKTQKTKSKVFQITIAEMDGYHMYYKEGKEKEELKDFIKKHKLKVIVHGRYLDQPFYSKNKGLFTYMKHEWRTCVELGVYGFIVHLNQVPIKRILEVLKEMSPPKELRIFLENAALKPRSDVIQYSNAKEIVALYNTVSKHVNIGICIDTCHIFASGLDVGDPKVMKDFLTTILKTIPKKDLIFHLNDSKADLGTGRDLHEYICSGKIWGLKSRYGPESLKMLLKKKIDCIIERWGEYNTDYKCLTKMGYAGGGQLNGTVMSYVVKV